ncbi:TRAP transporter substrate-binding protein [Desulfobacula sp.]|uniref:TRAP transporter substrate-binding protein n=1 Tax=Desulfobacula sp. TaxID=2593537 RepID=UPI00261CA59E|nr:TRAP transporter substrate-binding protein [Desulfobacula sp.]
MMTKSATCKIFLCVALTITAGLLFCASVHAQKAVKLRYFTGMTSSHYFSADLLPFFATEIEKRTQGSIQVTVYPGGQLFGYRNGIDATTMGAVEMGLTALGHWGGRNPVFSFSDYFLLIDDMDHWFRARDAVNAILEPLFREKNVKLLYYSAYGGNGICGKIKIESLDDLRGLKIRAPVPGALASLSAWGATPIKIASAEVYDAMGKGAIDAFSSSWSSMYSRKYYEVANHAVGPIWWTVWVNFINLDTWNSLSPENQTAMMAVSEETEKRSLGVMKAFDQKSLKKLAEVGTVKILTPEEKKAWGKSLRVAYAEWVQKCADKGYGKQAKDILEILDRTR